MELTKISDKIESLIKDLGSLRFALKQHAKDKAVCNSNYEKQLAKTIIQLKNGVKFELDGEEIQNPPTTILEKIARGICFYEKLKADESEAMYKSLILNIETIKAQLNGYQSILRYLDEN